MHKLEGFFVKSEELAGSWGSYPSSRSMEEHIKNGIVIIDKPAGPTSHQVTAWVRDMLSLSKAGHAGTLDPQVTGVLVTALGNATKVMPALISSQKEYVCVMQLHGDVTEKKLNEVMRSFTGKISQLPPIKSAVKRVLREREVYELEVLEREGRHVLFRVKCEAGTYIRKLCTDVGAKLGCGAQMLELRRTESGRFHESQAATLQDLRDAYEIWKENGEEGGLRDIILPVEMAAGSLGKLVVKDTAINALCNGAPLAAGGVVAVEKGIKAGAIIAVFSRKGELVGLGKSAKSSEDMNEMEKGLVAKMERIVMKRDVYPKTW